jgi:copper(I)-binding protein
VGDRLVAVRTPAAAKAELHSMKMDGDVMRMREVESVEVPAGLTVTLAPGGLHVMLIGPKRALAKGDTVVAILQFEKAGEVSVNLAVGQGPAKSADGGMPGHKH